MPTDVERRTRLRRMKVFATALLAVAAAVYAVTAGRDGALGYVNAAAEAAMVGAIADWFAVTALFRRPLGLPIPHTALIPTRKDEIGKGLEDFVATSFLSEPVVRERIAQSRLASRIGTWLAEPRNADRVGAEAAVLASAALRVLRDEDVVTLLEKVLIQRIAEFHWSPLAGRLLEGVVTDGTHHRLVDLLLEEADAWLAENRETVIDLVADRAPSWTPSWVDRGIGARVHTELVRWVADVSTDPDHRVRKAADDMLATLARDLQHDDGTRASAEALKHHVLAHPQLAEATAAVWSSVRRLLAEAVDDPAGELRQGLSRWLGELGERLATDEGLQRRLDSYVEDAAGYVVRTYAGEVAGVISDTVARWDGQDAARRIELHVGRDLQVIRINGTVVGALVGLAIHTATELLA